MTRQAQAAARRTILAWAIRLADERAELDILTADDGQPVAHLTWGIDQARTDDQPKRSTSTTCLRYYNEVTDDQACPCGCEVTR